MMPNNWWFFRRLDQFWDASMLFDITAGYPADVVRNALEALLQRHDVLRSVWHRNGSNWCRNERDLHQITSWWEVIDLTTSSYPTARQVLEQRCQQEQHNLSIEHLLFKAVYFDLGAFRPARLLLCIHHLLMDSYSQWIIVSELDELCRYLSESPATPTAGLGRTAPLPPRTSTLAALADHWDTVAHDDALRTDVGIWRSMSWNALAPLPEDPFPASLEHVPGVASLMTVKDTLGTANSQRLLAVCARNSWKLGVEDLLITAVMLSVRDWSGANTLLLNLTHHGREAPPAGFDVSRTVGWIGDYVPVLFDIGSTHSLETARSIHAQRDALRGKETHFTLLKHVCPWPDTRAFFTSLPEPQLELNYMPPSVDPYKQATSIAALGFSPARESLAPRDGRMQANFTPYAKIYFDEFDALTWHWLFPRNVYREQTFQGFIHNNLHHLGTLIDALDREVTP